MSNLWKIIAGVGLGAAIVFLLLWQVKGCKDDKKIAGLTDSLYQCRHAPLHTDTIIRYDTVYINKVKTKIAYHTDTIWEQGHLVEVNSYLDTLKTADFDLFYGLKTVGVLKEISFPKYTLHTKEIITEKTVLKDTCAGKLKIRDKSHFSVYADAVFLNELGGVGAGFDYTYRNKVGFFVGTDYLIKEKALVGRAGLKIVIK